MCIVCTCSCNPHTPASLHRKRSLIRCTDRALYYWHQSYLIFLLSLIHIKPSVVSPPSYLTLLSPLGFHSIPPPSIYLCNIYLFLLPPSWTNEFWMWSVWGPKLLPYCSISSWVLPRCTKCLSWILNKPRDLLCVSWSAALLLPSYYSARGPGALAGWMGFESVLLWANVEIIDMGGLSVWSCLLLSLAIMKHFLLVL